MQACLLGTAWPWCFPQVEEFSEKPIEEMPVHVSDIFAQ
jgi:hypothetical protein